MMQAAKIKPALISALGGLESTLSSTTYLVGHKLGLADVSLVCSLAPVFDKVSDLVP